MSEWTLAEWISASALGVAALGVLLTAVTLAYVVKGELRVRRQYHSVDWDLDYIGLSNHAGVHVCRLTNIGSLSATQVSIVPSGALPGTTLEHRRIAYVSPGETKELLVECDDLASVWILVGWIPVHDRRIIDYTWLPLDPDGPLAETYWEQNSWSRREYRKRVRMHGGRPAPVGPEGVPSTYVKSRSPDKRRDGQDRATEHAMKWLHDRISERESLNSPT